MFNNVAGTLVKRANQIVVAIALVAGILTFAFGGGKTVEQAVERVRERVMPKTASGNFVVVAIDQESMTRLQAWPWPRSLHGRLVDKLNEYGVKSVAFDVDFTSPAADPKQDRLFAASLARSQAPVSMIGSQDVINGKAVDAEPNPMLRPHVQTVSGWINVDTDTGRIMIPYHKALGGRMRLSIATAAAGKAGRAGQQDVDWSIGYRSVPIISYADVLSGNVPREALRGRSVIVGATAQTLGDRWNAPDGFRIPGVAIHALAAETQARSVPTPLGAFPLLLAAGILIAIATLIGNRLAGSLATLTTGIAVIGVSWLAREHFGVVLEVAPAIGMVATTLTMQVVAGIGAGVMTKITTDDVTDLPNLTAMRIERPAGMSTVAVRIRNHLDTATVLGPKLQAELLRRARDRIRLAAGDSRIYQVDEHSFAWRTDFEGAALSDSVEGLVALFAGGLKIEERTVDVPVTAGICDTEDDIQMAVTAALLAADHAARQGLPWTKHQDDTADAEWRITMMSELDRALSGDEDAGTVWVAYQPKYDLHSDRIVSSEALVRWTHPARGPIRPDHFIHILEEAGRIDRLTAFVLETAIRDFSKIGGIGVAVNLSTRMLGLGRIVGQVRDLIAKYSMPAELLTLEITESAVLTGDTAITELDELRAMGVQISIDDYGTGQSTLNYLKRLPATELKVDQSFVRAVLTSKSDQVMIASTISLAHALELKVVAEGVETAEVLEALRGLDCDVIQGYHIGKPMPLGDFIREVAGDLVMRRVVGG